MYIYVLVYVLSSPWCDSRCIPYIGADSKVVNTSVRRCAPSESAARVLGAPTPQPHPDPFPHRGSREAVR